MPVRLPFADPRLAALCRAAEAACGDVNGERAWPVVVHPDFSGFTEAVRAQTFAHTFALYHAPLATILVNQATYLPLAEPLALAVLVHEIGHAYLATVGAAHVDCFAADAFACDHGQEAVLIADRDEAYGTEYADLLRKRGTPNVRSLYTRWYLRYLAGLC